jgi:hypothetical protein
VLPPKSFYPLKIPIAYVPCPHALALHHL